jgi:hypothetical protein
MRWCRFKRRCADSTESVSMTVENCALLPLEKCAV